MFQVGDKIRVRQTGRTARIISIGSAPLGRPDDALFNIHPEEGGPSVNVASEEIEPIYETYRGHADLGSNHEENAWLEARNQADAEQQMRTLFPNANKVWVHTKADGPLVCSDPDCKKS